MLLLIATRCPCTRSAFIRRLNQPLSLRRMSSDQLQRKSTRVSEYLTFNRYHQNVTESGKTPTVLFLPWITATPRSAQRFENLYGQRGFNVVTVWSKVKYFVWPKSCLTVATSIIDYLRAEVEGDIVVHGMSIGAYVYACILLAAARDEARHKYLKDHIKGNVFDSIVYGGTRRMATGLSVMISDNVVLEKVITAGLLAYLRLLKSQTEDIHNATIEAFINNPYLPSALLMFTTIDPMSDEKMLEKMGEDWQERGVHVQLERWTDCGHAELFKSHPKEYIGALEKYLAFIKPTLGLMLNSKL